MRYPLFKYIDETENRLILRQDVSHALCLRIIVEQCRACSELPVGFKLAVEQKVSHEVSTACGDCTEGVIWLQVDPLPRHSTLWCASADTKEAPAATIDLRRSITDWGLHGSWRCSLFESGQGYYGFMVGLPHRVMACAQSGNALSVNLLGISPDCWRPIAPIYTDFDTNGLRWLRSHGRLTDTPTYSASLVILLLYLKSGFSNQLSAKSDGILSMLKLPLLVVSEHSRW